MANYPLRGLVFVVMCLLGPMRWRGSRNIPRTGGVLILANHIADIDPVVVQLACPRLIRFMGKSELFAIPVIGWFIKWFGAFPVKRGEPDRQALRWAVDLLKAGEVVCMYPEGQLSEDGTVQAILPGAALIVRLSGVPVVCCGIRGSNKVMPYHTLFPRPAFSWVEANWGEPRAFDKSSETEEIVEWVGAELRRLTGQSD